MAHEITSVFYQWRMKSLVFFLSMAHEITEISVLDVSCYKQRNSFTENGHCHHDDEERDSVHTVSTDSGTVIYLGDNCNTQHQHQQHAVSNQCSNCSQCASHLRVDVTSPAETVRCSNAKCSLLSKDDISPSSDSGLPSSCSQNSSCVVGAEERQLDDPDYASKVNNQLDENDFSDSTLLVDNGGESGATIACNNRLLYREPHTCSL